MDAEASPSARSNGGVSDVRGMRNHNLAILARAVVTSHQHYSRAQLASLTGLNRSTVTRLVDQLIQYGIVIEAESRTGRTGRPSVPLAPAEHTHVAIGAEISSEMVHLAVVDLAGHVLAEHFAELPDSMDPCETLRIYADSLAQITAKASSAHLDIAGAACGIPGVISHVDGLLCTAPNMRWRDVELNSTLARVASSPLPPVVFDNAATLAAQSEQIYRMKRGEPQPDFVYVTGSTGVGAALIRGGAIETGVHGWGGEIGHIVVSDAPTKCSCGATGCLETFAGMPSIMKAAHLDSQDSPANLFAKLHRRAPAAVSAVKSAGLHLGRAISAYLNLVEVPVVILGGNFRALFTDISEPLLHEIRTRVLYSDWSPIRVEPAKVGEHAVSTGAAWGVLSAFLDEPDRWIRPAPFLLNYYSVTRTPEITLEDTPSRKGTA